MGGIQGPKSSVSRIWSKSSISDGHMALKPLLIPEGPQKAGVAAVTHLQ